LSQSQSIYPRDFFSPKGGFFSRRRPNVREKTGRCFVLMPFDQKFLPVYDTIEKTIEGNDLNMHCRRGDDLTGGGYIIQSILESIAESEFIIADLTDRNPNVFYELGIAHMAKDHEKVILLTQSMNFVPFDLQHFRYIVYEQTSAGLYTLKSNLIDHLRSDEEKLFRFAIPNPQRQTNLVAKPLFSSKDRHFYQVEITESYSDSSNIKFRMKIYKLHISGSRDVISDNGYGSRLYEPIPLEHVPWELRYEGLIGDRAIFALEKIRE
jgi:hypothetical protein